MRIEAAENEGVEGGELFRSINPTLVLRKVTLVLRKCVLPLSIEKKIRIVECQIFVVFVSGTPTSFWC